MARPGTSLDASEDGSTMDVAQSLTFGGIRDGAAARLRDWQEHAFGRRLWEKDPTLWSPEPVAEITDRLGWLHLPETMMVRVDEVTTFAREVQAAGMRHVALLGMGGSSLAPEVFQRTFGNVQGYPALVVLDSTHPASVRAAEAVLDLSRTLFVVSSKSGTTTETLSLFQYFWQQVAAVSRHPGTQFVAITDPETPLERLAAQRGFRRTWLAPADVGGRYSALTVFGLVPAALIGVDIRTLLDRALTMARACGSSIGAVENPGLLLGAAIGEAARAGRDKLTLVTSSTLAALPSWIEQLVAESTGKDGKGIVPVCEEMSSPPDMYGGDRFFVCMRAHSDDSHDLDQVIEALEARGHPIARIEIAEPADLGAEFFRWEVAVAAAGAVLGIHPFNQPDVQLAKELTTRAMADGRAAAGVTAVAHSEVSVEPPHALAQSLCAWMISVRPGDYVAVQAYLPPTPALTAALQQIRGILSDRLHVPTTLGYGPRFLHSTGQLHKGGPDTGVVLQLVDDPSAAGDLPIPETRDTFGALIRAQALGDLQALRQRGRRVLRLDLGADAHCGLQRLIETMRSLA